MGQLLEKVAAKRAWQKPEQEEVKEEKDQEEFEEVEVEDETDRSEKQQRGPKTVEQCPMLEGQGSRQQA